MLRDFQESDILGGIKSIYDVYEQTYFTLMINFPIIGLKTFNIPVKRGIVDTVIYYRPTKKIWNTKRDRIPYNYWGKVNNPYTNVILQLGKDFENIHKEIGLLHYVKFYFEMDGQLAKIVRKQTRRFVIEIKNNLI